MPTRKRSPAASGTAKKSRKAPTPVCCELRYAGGEVPIRDEQNKLQQLAMKWSYMVRNRHRWSLSETRQKEIEQEARADMLGLGLGEAELRQLANQDVIEVSVSYVQESVNWAARIFPWEFIISRLIKPYHTGGRFTLIRYLHQENKPLTGKAGNKTLLFVQSAPGSLAESYLFDEEIERMCGLDWKSHKVLKNPTAEELQRNIEELRPDTIHITGIDAHEGAELLGANLSERQKRSLRDGLYMATADGRETLVEAEELSALLNPSAAKDYAPQLVSFNLYNSASRLAALAVAQGAQAAIGFQDSIDNELAELFFADFYRLSTGSNAPSGADKKVVSPGLDTVPAFYNAWRALASIPNRERGSGLVLWSARSYFADKGSKRAQEKRHQENLRWEQERRAQAAVSLEPAEREGERLSDLVRVSYQLPGSLNYARLHNDENIFDSLVLIKTRPGILRGVQVRVDLQVGGEVFSYQRTLDLADSIPLRDAVRVPLAWSLAKELTESVQTTVHLLVSRHGEIILQDTHSVSLLPVNEWKDDTISGPWLPSFVLPRDPCVREVIGRAQRYLRVLLDDGIAGFDGYQSISPVSRDEVVGDADADIIDTQVRAIWSSLLHDYRIGYINPPPTFTAYSQRLRRPSDVLEGGHGTCIDLALLLAACLEYIGMRPVLFLIRGHAFPGYWRSEASIEVVDTPAAILAKGVAEERISGMHSRSDNWSTGSQGYEELLALIARGHLVPVEATSLTMKESFIQACDKGLENLEDPLEFETLLDVGQARRYGVTPLPY